ncbi:hypothetical protein Pint_25113 [Pistacia integerrima]|uniref:Uncharacterized protein n=1 Tax=Pistacia integerrima TaxID=434235 RepID=A0ACC0YCF2_9ROSI|nr:hypothetical protein Pint_25113 [Pistacia integerrima]
MYCLNVLFASQLNHKSILKLIRCCLETQIPILVFESIEYETLADRNHRPSHPCFKPLLFTNRLKIAVEIANAIAYLHFRFAKPILFRIIKPWNILIDKQNIVKLFDFSLSVSIPKGETHIKDVGRGTMGFVAPEYVTTRGCFNEKCDVFCFDVLLFVLLTGQEITDYLRCEKGNKFYLVYDVKKYFVNNRVK